MKLSFCLWSPKEEDVLNFRGEDMTLIVDYKKLVETSTTEEIIKLLEKSHQFSHRQKLENKRLRKKLKKYEKDNQIVDNS